LKEETAPCRKERRKAHKGGKEWKPRLLIFGVKKKGWATLYKGSPAKKKQKTGHEKGNLWPGKGGVLRAWGGPKKGESRGEEKLQNVSCLSRGGGGGETEIALDSPGKGVPIWPSSVGRKGKRHPVQTCQGGDEPLVREGQEKGQENEDAFGSVQGKNEKGIEGVLAYTGGAIGVGGQTHLLARLRRAFPPGGGVLLGPRGGGGKKLNSQKGFVELGWGKEKKRDLEKELP